MNHQAYGFVHIPKTGGTSVGKFLNDNYPNKFICSRFPGNNYHSLTTSDVDEPIVVVRCPIDRFMSAFRYWRNGPINGPWIKRYSNLQYQDLSITDFVVMLDNNPEIVNTSLTGRLHFLQQSYWIREKDYSKTIVINYNKDLKSSIDKLITYLKLPNYTIPIEKLNQTDSFSDLIPDEIFNYIQTKYADDFRLLHLVSSRQDIFRFVI